MLLSEKNILFILEILKKNNKTIVIDEVQIQQISSIIEFSLQLLADTLRESEGSKNPGGKFIKLLHLLIFPVGTNEKSAIADNLNSELTNVVGFEEKSLKGRISEILEYGCPNLNKICGVMQILLHVFRENQERYNIPKLSKTLSSNEARDEPTTEEIKAVFLICIELKIMEVIQNPSVFSDLSVNAEDRLMGFWLACECGYTPVVEFLLHQEGIKEIMNQRLAPENATPFIMACERGHLDIVKLLRKAGADVSAKMPSGETGLVLAYRQNHLPVVSFLMEEKKKQLDEITNVDTGSGESFENSFLPSGGVNQSSSGLGQQQEDEDDVDLDFSGYSILCNLV